MRRWTSLVWIPLVLMAAATATAQARIVRVIPKTTGVRFARAGAAADEAAVANVTLQPGDLMLSTDSSLVELQCTTSGATTYRLQGPMRAMIDVPVSGRCDLNLLKGHADVIAEEPSHLTGGTVSMASKGTQYSVDVSRVDNAFSCTAVVFEGELTAGASSSIIKQGAAMRWTAAAMTPSAVTRQQVDRSATLYATFDVAASSSLNTASSANFERFKALHASVLSNPANTQGRVDLAKQQIAYKVYDQAGYNLKRANVTTDAALRLYKIDPRVVRANPTLNDHVFKTITPATTTSERATAASAIVPQPTPKTSAAASGVSRSSVAAMAARSTVPPTSSRELLALAKEYETSDPIKSRQNATRALAQHVTDGKLSAADLRDLRELLGRLN